MIQTVCAVVLGGGSSTRYGKNKLLEAAGCCTVVERAVAAFAKHPDIDEVIAVLSGDTAAVIAGRFPNVKIVAGGDTRLLSVKNGVAATDCDIVCIHDAARPFVSAALISLVVAAAKKSGGAAAFLPVRDSLRTVEGGFVVGALEREGVRLAQTPQAFLRKAYARALETASIYETDDCAVALKSGIPVAAVEGEQTNIKITYREDIMPDCSYRIGHGYDAHRFCEGRELWLCGVNIPSERGLLGHSDADCALHALMDALLGASACGDIGALFPDTDERYKGISSGLLLKEVVKRLDDEGFSVVNADITIICETPKLAPYRDAMRAFVASVLNLHPSRVSVKATTEEGMGFTGGGEGLCCHATALLTQKKL